LPLKPADITGGSRGIGAAIALRFAAEGARVVIKLQGQSSGRRDEKAEGVTHPISTPGKSVSGQVGLRGGGLLPQVRFSGYSSTEKDPNFPECDLNEAAAAADAAA
jgi:NAD(P)-dependent dehydrogenase (short-subunit alcohol dehydrogenase family)